MRAVLLLVACLACAGRRVQTSIDKLDKESTEDRKANDVAPSISDATSSGVAAKTNNIARNLGSEDVAQHSAEAATGAKATTTNKELASHDSEGLAQQGEAEQHKVATDEAAQHEEMKSWGYEIPCWKTFVNWFSQTSLAAAFNPSGPRRNSMPAVSSHIGVSQPTRAVVQPAVATSLGESSPIDTASHDMRRSDVSMQFFPGDERPDPREMENMGWNGLSREFEDAMAHLEKYKRNKGNLKIPRGYTDEDDGFPLYEWVQDVVERYYEPPKKTPFGSKRLTYKERYELEEIGLVSADSDPTPYGFYFGTIPLIICCFITVLVANRIDNGGY